MSIKSIGLLLLLFAVSGCGLTGKYKPVPVKSLTISDGEYLVYAGYSGGEKSFILHMVIRLKGNDHIVMYMGATNMKSKYKMREFYTNYEQQIDVSLTGASLVRSRDNWLDYIKFLNQKGRSGAEIDIRTNELEAYSMEYNWDGHNITTMTSKMRIKPGYSYWDINSLGLIGMRFLDLNKPGIVFVIAPEFAKEPVPVSFKYYGEETLEVPAGKFETRKYGFTVADPFLGNLLRKYSNEFLVWIEKGSRGLIVLAKSPWGETRLSKIETWK
jgi:hypothetical protein